MIDGKNFFDQAINSDLETNENIRKIAAGKSDDYTTGSLDLSKQQVLYAGPRAIQQINFTANLDRAGDATGEAKETVFEFSQGTVKVL